MGTGNISWGQSLISEFQAARAGNHCEESLRFPRAWCPEVHVELGRPSIWLIAGLLSAWRDYREYSLKSILDEMNVSACADFFMLPKAIFVSHNVLDATQSAGTMIL